MAMKSTEWIDYYKDGYEITSKTNGIVETKFYEDNDSINGTPKTVEFSTKHKNMADFSFANLDDGTKSEYSETDKFEIKEDVKESSLNNIIVGNIDYKAVHHENESLIMDSPIKSETEFRILSCKNFKNEEKSFKDPTFNDKNNDIKRPQKDFPREIAENVNINSSMNNNSDFNIEFSNNHNLPESNNQITLETHKNINQDTVENFSLKNRKTVETIKHLTNHSIDNLASQENNLSKENVEIKINPDRIIRNSTVIQTSHGNDQLDPDNEKDYMEYKYFTDLNEKMRMEESIQKKNKRLIESFESVMKENEKRYNSDRTISTTANKIDSTPWDNEKREEENTNLDTKSLDNMLNSFINQIKNIDPTFKLSIQQEDYHEKLYHSETENDSKLKIQRDRELELELEIEREVEYERQIEKQKCMEAEVKKQKENDKKLEKERKLERQREFERHIEIEREKERELEKQIEEFQKQKELEKQIENQKEIELSKQKEIDKEEKQRDENESQKIQRDKLQEERLKKQLERKREKKLLSLDLPKQEPKKTLESTELTNDIDLSVNKIPSPKINQIENSRGSEILIVRNLSNENEKVDTNQINDSIVNTENEMKSNNDIEIEPSVHHEIEIKQEIPIKPEITTKSEIEQKPYKISRETKTLNDTQDKLNTKKQSLEPVENVKRNSKEHGYIFEGNGAIIEVDEEEYNFPLKNKDSITPSSKKNKDNPISHKPVFKTYIKKTEVTNNKYLDLYKNRIKKEEEINNKKENHKTYKTYINISPSSNAYKVSKGSSTSISSNNQYQNKTYSNNDSNMQSYYDLMKNYKDSKDETINSNLEHDHVPDNEVDQYHFEDLDKIDLEVNHYDRVNISNNWEQDIDKHNDNNIISNNYINEEDYYNKNIIRYNEEENNIPEQQLKEIEKSIYRKSSFKKNEFDYNHHQNENKSNMDNIIKISREIYNHQLITEKRKQDAIDTKIKLKELNLYDKKETLDDHDGTIPFHLLSKDLMYKNMLKVNGKKDKRPSIPLQRK